MRKALEMALDALKDNQHLVADNERHAYVMKYNSIIDKCEEALAQPEQEPVAWRYGALLYWDKLDALEFMRTSNDGYQLEPLYTTPQPDKLAYYEKVADDLQALCDKQSLRIAELETQPEQEPVAWYIREKDSATTDGCWAKKNLDICEPLYTTPPQRKPLTDEQIQKCYETTGHYQTLRPQDKFAVFALARAIEAAHGIK